MRTRPPSRVAQPPRSRGFSNDAIGMRSPGCLTSLVVPCSFRVPVGWSGPSRPWSRRAGPASETTPGSTNSAQLAGRGHPPIGTKHRLEWCRCVSSPAAPQRTPAGSRALGGRDRRQRQDHGRGDLDPAGLGAVAAWSCGWLVARRAVRSGHDVAIGAGGCVHPIPPGPADQHALPSGTCRSHGHRETSRRHRPDGMISRQAPAPTGSCGVWSGLTWRCCGAADRFGAQSDHE